MNPPFVLALDGLPDTALAQRLRQALPAAEWQWVQRLRRPDDRLRSLCGRAALRLLLAPRLGMPPTEIPLSAGPWGKPLLAAAPHVPPGWHFNIAHSAGQVLVAIGRQPLGVDVEACPTRVDPALYQLTTGESGGPANLPPDPQVFCREWVCREAILKAHGTGLARPMDTLRLHPGPGGWQRVSGLPRANRLHVRLLWQSDAHCAALCLPVTETAWRLEHYTMSSWFYTRI
ncbi:4'-phosphopantetheinyl transferase family protein [Castellaniella hirudinis]|uniref:4'-phosphopantetheinyl transferase family protein n=1 Tax=Castellaniella hirudinis TaxID=1144617 RepID=UPI0039C0A4D6